MLKKIHGVGVLIENEKNEIFVVLRNKDEVEGNTWGPVGGEIEKGESKEAALVRELKEEINLTGSVDRLRFQKTFALKYPERLVTFELFKMKVEEAQMDVTLQTSEATKFMWAKPADLYKRKDLIHGLYEILADIYHLS